MGEVAKFKSNHAYGELKSRLVGKASPSRKDAQNTFLTLKEFLESKFSGTKGKLNSVDAFAIGVRHGIDPDLLISVKKSADQIIIAKTGQVLYGERTSDLFGSSTDMSEDGLHLAVGSIFNDDGGANSGSVRVYSRGSEEEAWVQKGVDINGEAAQDYSGWSISLSSDGNRLVVGAVFNDFGSTINSGHVRIYDWNSGATRWDQLGSDLDGDSAGDFFGYSVSLSKNKNYLAVGAPYGLDTRGYVKVYYYNGTTWDQVNTSLVGGVDSYEYFGKSVALSEDGSRLVVSASHYNFGTGKVNLYNVDQGSNSIHLLDSILGTGTYSRIGNSLDLKSNTVAVSDTVLNDSKIITYDITSDSFVEQANNKISLPSSFDVRVKLSYDGKSLIYGVSGFNTDGALINSGTIFGIKGHVKVFKRQNNSWVLNGWKMNQIGGRINDEFGKSVSISGDGGIICISAPRKDVPTSDTGCVTTYTLKPISHYVTPTITLNFLNPYPLQANTTYVEPGAVTDTGADITITGEVGDSTIEGTEYDILYTAQDGFGNVVTKTRTVVISKDPAIPTMVLNGDATVLVKVDGIFNDPGVTTSVLSTVITDNSALNLNTLGAYEVKYTAVSSYGITSSQTISRTVVVVNDIDFAGSALTGKNVCMSTDGFMVGVGDFADDTVVFNEWDPVGKDWKSIGQKIQGPANSSFSGTLALSDDGLTVVIGAPTFNLTGLVRVYEYKFHVNKWVQKGGDIIEGVEGDTIGEFVTISGDGSVVSCGASQPTGVKNPYIFTYKYSSSSTTWVKIHEYMEPITLGNSVDKKKFSGALNSDGSLLLIGSPMNNYTTGAVFVYDTSDASLKFSVLGAEVGNYFGESVNFSANARRLAIGDVGGACVKIYNQDEVTNVWSQLGSKIYEAGTSVNLSKNGDIVTFSIPATQGYGKVYQYKWDGLFWLPIIDEFSDNGNGTSFGRQVFVSEDGSSILVESAITNQLYRWNVGRPVFSLNGNRIVRAGVDQLYEYDYVTTSSKVVISGEVDTSVTDEYVIKYTMIRNPSDVVYQVVSTSGELLQLGLTIQSFATSSTPIKLGWSTSISGDGNYLVVGMPGYDEDRGMVKIYQLNLTDVTWDEMISLTGPNVGGSFGYDVSISRDGSRVAVGAPDFGAGMVLVYEYTTAWGLLGSQIDGNETGDKFGWSVSLNGSGEYLTVGEPRRSFQINTGVGGVKTYRYISSQWESQTSLSFENNQVEHQIGYDVVISSSNNVVLFGAPTAGPGYVKISSYLDGNVPIFAQPMTFGERFGWCVSISDDGTIFAVSAPFFNARRGRVLIYDATTTPPSLRGSPIEGVSENDELGESLHLSGNGQKLLLYSKQGRVSNYQYVGSEWVIISDEVITSEVTDSNFGYSLSSSTTGNRMVISSPLFENSSGMVQIFSTETLQISNADFIPPVIALNGESLIVHEKDTTFNDPGVTRDDGEVSFDVTGAIDSSAVGSYTLAYSATDVAGNVSNPLSRIVNIKDPNELNQISKFIAPIRSRNRNTAIAEKRVVLCTPAVKVYDVSDDVFPAVYNQVAQVLPDGDQVGLSQDGTKLYITKFIDATSGKLSVHSLSEAGFTYAQTPFSNAGTPSVSFTTMGNYANVRMSTDKRNNLFGTGVVPFGEEYRQSFKFKNLAMSNDGLNVAIGKPRHYRSAADGVMVYQFSPGTIENEIFNQVGNTTSGSFIDSLSVSEVGDRLITQDGGRVLIYNRDDSSATGWNLEFEHTGTTQGKVAMSHDGNVAAFVISPSLNVDPITLIGDSTIQHGKGETFTDPGFSYSGGGPVTVTGTVDTDTVGEYIITYEVSNDKQIRIVRVNDLPTLTIFNGSYSTTNIPYGPNFAGYTGTWRNQDFPLFTVPVGFVQPTNPEFELSITLNGRVPSTHSGGWQYMSIRIYTDNGFSSSISFSTNGSGPGESYSYSGTTFNNRIRTKTTIDSGSLSAGDQVRGRLNIYNTFFSTFDVDVTTTISIVATTTPVPIPKVTLIGFPQNNIDVGENFVDPGVTSDNSTDVISVIDAPTFPQATSSIQAIIYRAVNTSGVSGYAVRYVNIADVEKVVIYGRSGVAWSQVANSISTPASLETYSFKDISLSSNGNRVVFSKYNKNIVYDLDQTAYPQVWTKTGEITRDAVCIKISGDGNRIVMGDSIGLVYLYEYSNGVWGQELTIPHNTSLPGNAGDYETASIDISKGGEYIIAGYKSSSQNGGVTVYTTIDGNKRGQTINPQSSPFVVGDKVSISSDGTKLLTMKSYTGGLTTFAYYEYESGSWIEHGPGVYSGTINLLNLSLSGNGNNLLLLYANRFITNTPATETTVIGWEKIGSDIIVNSITYPPYHTNPPPSTPGARETPGGILSDSDHSFNLGEIGHVVEISDNGLIVAIGLPFLHLGTGSVVVATGAAVVFQWDGSNWVQLGGLIVPKYTNNASLTLAQNLTAESTMYSGASISLSGDGQYLCVGSPGYHADAADKVVSNSGQRLNSLPSADGATKWTLYKRNATYAPANDYYSVGWEPIHTKYSEMSTSLLSINTQVSKRELIGHNVKVSSDGSFVVYDTRTDGIKIEAFNSTTNTWGTSQHIPNGVTTYLNDVEFTVGGTTYPYPIHFLGKKTRGYDPFNSDGDDYVEDWDAALNVGKGGYVARMWPHSYISLASNDKFLTVSEPEVTLPTFILNSIGLVVAHTFTKSNRSARVNVYKRDSGGTWSLHGPMIESTSIPHFASSYSSISDDGKRLVVPSKDDFSKFHTYTYNVYNESWTIGTTPQNIDNTNHNGSLTTLQIRNYTAAAQSITIASGDGTKVASLYFGDPADDLEALNDGGWRPQFKIYTIGSLSTSTQWNQRGGNINLSSTGGINTLDTVLTVSEKIITPSVSISNDASTLAVGLANDNVVKVFKYSNDTWGEVASLTGTGQFGDQLVLTRDGNSLAVSAPGSGKIFLYDTSMSSTTQETITMSSDYYNRIYNVYNGGSWGNREYYYPPPNYELSDYGPVLRDDPDTQFTLTWTGATNHGIWLPVTFGSIWSVSFEWNVESTGGDDMRFIFYAPNQPSSSEGSQHGGYNVYHEFYGADSHAIRTPTDSSLSSISTTYAYYSWMPVTISYDNGVLTTTVGTSVNRSYTFTGSDLTAQQALWGTSTYIAISGNTGGVGADSIIKDIDITWDLTTVTSVTPKANTLQNTSVHSNGNFGYSLGLSDDCTRLFIGDPDYSNDVSDQYRDTGRVVIKEYDATVDSGGTGLPLGFSLGTEIEIVRGGNLQVATDRHTRFGESLDVSGDGARLIASRFGLLDTTFVGDPYTSLEISELWDRDSQTGNWSKKNLQSLVPIMTGSISSGNSEQYYQSPIVKISDSGDYFFYGVSEPSNTSYGSNVALTTTQQYFSPVLTLNGASRIEIIIGLPYTELGCTSDDPNDTMVITGNVDITVLGVYTVRYTVTRFGLSSFIERKVVIKISTVQPTITLIGDPVINLFQPVVYTEPNPGATAVGGTLETYGSPPNGSSSGTFTMRYVVRNTFGTATVQRTITIENDTTPPVITPWGGNVTHKFNTTYNDPSYIGSDGNEAILVSAPSHALTISNIPLYRGTNLITYSTADQAGNVGTYVRNVDVKDGMEATTIQQQLDDSYYSAISSDGSRQAIIRKATNDVVIYGVPASSIQLQLSGFGSMDGQMVKLSSDGTVMAFTASDGVRVYANGVERLAAVSRFVEPGSSMYHIELSNDGDTIAVSYPGGNTQYLEEVVIFRWNSTQYVEDHSIANATSTVTGLGDTISLSSDGNRIALGSSKITTGSGSNISSTIYSFATPSPTLDGVQNWYDNTQRSYRLTRYGVGGSNNTMYWSVTLGASWSVSWEWYIYGPRWGGADDMRLIYYATNPITAYQASVHNGYNNFYEFWEGDTHQIRDNNDIYKKSVNMYYPLSRWLNVDVSYDNGVMTSTVKNGNTVISKITHDFGAAHQDLYGVQTYFGFSGRTGGVSSTQYIRNINLKTSQEKTGQIEVYDRNGANSWSQVGGDIQGGLENQGLGKNVKLSGDGSTIFNKNEGLDANGQNVSVFALNSGTWTKNSTLIDNLNTRTVLTGNTHELIDISDDGSLLIYAKGTGSEKYVSHPSGLSTKYIDGYKLESGVYKHSLTIPESSSSPTKLVQVTGDGSKVLLHTDNDIVLHSVTDTVFNPVITLTHKNDSDTLRVSTYTEQGATSNVTDGSSVVVGGDTVTNTPGTYRVRYSVTDSLTSKSAHRTRTVVII